ncbi:hypothetical protein B0T25DRAFT_54516, partial [Lasiosphaeria hispida]
MAAPQLNAWHPRGGVPLPPPSRYRRFESLVAARNLFAFLTSQPLVGTRGNPAVFAALLTISSLLCQFGFSSYDGSFFSARTLMQRSMS